MIRGYPCKITEMTVAKMMHETSGRVPTERRDPPQIWCNICDVEVTGGGLLQMSHVLGF
jgi:hypothetical protein